MINLMDKGYQEVKMREGSSLAPREWSIIKYIYNDLHNFSAGIQEKVSQTWKRSHLHKAIKEDERRKASYIFQEVAMQLGNREKICDYHRLLDGNNHKNIHCKYSPCYLHAWKYYKLCDELKGTVTKTPGARIHLNGECK